MLRMRITPKLLGMSMMASLPNRSIHTVVMLRHGESLWNVENRFTGWCDVPLTAHGEVDAIDAGILMGERGLKFDVAFTSNLERAWRTCALTLAAAGQSGVETVRSSMLNERHYGGEILHNGYQTKVHPRSVNDSQFFLSRAVISSTGPSKR